MELEGVGGVVSIQREPPGSFRVGWFLRVVAEKKLVKICWRKCSWITHWKLDNGRMKSADVEAVNEGLNFSGVVETL